MSARLDVSFDITEYFLSLCESARSVPNKIFSLLRSRSLPIFEMLAIALCTAI